MIFSIVTVCCTYVCLAGVAALQIHVVSSKITNDKQVAFTGISVDKMGNIAAEFSKISPEKATSFGVIKISLKNISDNDVEIEKDEIVVMDSNNKKVGYLGLVNFKGAMGVPDTKDLFAYTPGTSPGKIRKNEVKDFEILIQNIPARGSKDFTIQYKEESPVKIVLKK